MRVSIRLDAIGFDVTLPGDVPVAELLPAVHDIGIAHGADQCVAALARHLYVPGVGPVAPSESLTAAGVADGDLLVLGTAPVPPVHPRGADPPSLLAQQTLDQSRWSPRRSRIAALSVAVCAAAALGYTAIPGAPVPGLLLAGAAVATVAVPAARWVPDVTDVVAPVGIAAALVVTTALPAMMFGGDATDAGIGLCVLAVVLLAAAGRAVLLGAGSRRGPLRLARLHGAAVSGAAVAAALGAMLAADAALTALVAAVLLLRAGHPLPPPTRVVLLAAGTITASVGALVSAAFGATWPAPNAALVCLLAIGWAVAGPPTGLARARAATERVALLAVLPAAAWASGLP
ncbi:EsaB/YukD family protein [[Mycobacterium] wendilense]|uniref:EsaB/YukD family protein n=1 Tax=[Mycobacterium] wendilense TaxID=3064284 RepID=A0ABM9MH89_9MYCO|nr:EsaB/YukD family protein [Mycolicibacterium sp. MU0050]CAJ1585162.1 EsaB/YukD family protein [Mycolicibacterium sp. MU0050]